MRVHALPFDSRVGSQKASVKSGWHYSAKPEVIFISARGLPIEKHCSSPAARRRWEDGTRFALVFEEAVKRSNKKPQVMPLLNSSARKFAGNYLVFTRHGEADGVDILKVREVIRHAGIATAPRLFDGARRW